MLDGVLLVSRKAYSFAKMAPVVEWQEFPCTIESIHMPKDIDVRMVEADLKDISLCTEFPELNIRWDEENKLIRLAEDKFFSSSPLYAKHSALDIVVFIQEAKIAIVLQGCNIMKQKKMFKADSIQSIKDTLT